MQKPVRLTLPLSGEKMASLHAGDAVLLSGTIYTARDAAHKRLCAMLERGEDLPINLDGAAIYYCGPTPARENECIGSCGPTTSSRMDDYTPALLRAGLRVMIGKGKRSDAVNAAIGACGAVYFAAVGGAGALYKESVLSCACVAFDDLGCEAIYKLQVRDMPLIVATDATGNTFLK